MHRRLTLFLPAICAIFVTACASSPKVDTGSGNAKPTPRTDSAAFAALAADVVDQLPALSPVSATSLGDHRFDDQLDDVSPAARAEATAFYEQALSRLASIDVAELTRSDQIDAALLKKQLQSELWKLATLREWEWNPLVYTGTAGSSVYALMARDFAPLSERLMNAAARLEQLPRFLEQVRGTLKIENVPNVHATTAAAQNRGVLSIIDAMIKPEMGVLSDADRAQLERAIDAATAAIHTHQDWLDNTLVPGAKGEFRIGAELFDRKLEYTLHSPLTRAEIRARAQREFDAVRARMYDVARQIVEPDATETPSEATQQKIIEAGLARAYAQVPGRDEIVAVAQSNLEETTAFVRAKDLVEVPDDPIEIILMPEFQRGVAVAYCDAPGPLDRGQQTFYAVAPLPENWTDEQVASFLREYNLLSIQDLTIHEAMPGHFLQLALSNRHPSVIRAMLASGPFIEGWAVYAERMMIDEGYLNNDPLMRLINLKWYLRAIANAIIDQAIHVDGMTRDEAMALMTRGAFQEEREAAGKWVRAQLSSTQLSTYFVGYQEHADLRRETEAAWGDEFTLRRYHDTVLSFGSPPGQFVRAQVLGLAIPRD
ncbi:MAG: DUF885 domain-containing protein [Pseudomonadota bacterium]